MSNPYHVMGLAPDCSTEEVNKRYRALALRYHPDKCKEEIGDEKFKLISKAYQEIIEYKYDFILPVSYRDLLFGGTKLLNLTALKWQIGNEIISPASCSCFGEECKLCQPESRLQIPEGAIKNQVKFSMEFQIPPKSWCGRLVPQGNIVARLKAIQTPSLYHRDATLFYIIEMHLYQALLGYDKIESIADEDHHICFPHPIKNGDRLVKEGEGLYDAEENRGTLTIIFRVKYPTHISPAEEALIKSLINLKE